ncbi:MAG: hypothetical protein Q4P20_08965 [Eubacteriales bacterium]|nr:hypothetical protein [Eubacteriales bacterium]
MKKYLTKRNIILVVLCIVVLVGCGHHYYRKRAEMKQQYFNAVLTAANKGWDMTGGRITPESDEHFHELRDTFIVAKTQLFDLRGDEATLREQYNSYPKAFDLIEWYAGFNVSNIPLTFDVFTEDSADAQIQQLCTATQILIDHYTMKIVNDETPPQSFEEYLQLIENDPRTAEIDFEET